MSETLKYEQALKEVRSYFEPETLPVTKMTWDDIKQLDLEETTRALKSIQSKKCNTQYLTANKDDNEQYQAALKIEEMLKQHRTNIRPIEDSEVSKADINNLIKHIENQDKNLDKDYVLSLLGKFLEQ